MVGYTAIEQAVRAKILSTFSAELNESRCRSGDMDGALLAIFDEGAGYGCFIEYNGGHEDNRKPFDRSVWIWSMVCVIAIKYEAETIEARMRAAVDKVSTMFAGDHTCGGVSPLVRIVDLGDAQPVQVNDFPFYWLPFVVEAIDK